MGTQKISRVGIVGGGFMGSGIAESVARAETPVSISEPWTERLDYARQSVERSVDRAVRGEKITRDQASKLTQRITYTTQISDLAYCDLVIEAVTEDVGVKGEVFAELDSVTAPDAILASNTSSIPIAQLAASTGRGDRVIGLHFFSPVPVMRLVEVVTALDTSDSTVEAARTFVQSLSKRPILTKDRSGFVVNMLLVPYLMAAVRMYEEGFSTREDIDAAMQLGCGHPMGPLTLCDFIGLDVLYSVCDSLYEEFKRAEYAPPPLMKRMVASGRLGRKVGHGFYEYS
jgi:3-hydroxybutyryl-CoA dehydrogenase